MAKDVTGNPWKFDASTQSEGYGNRNESTVPVFKGVKPFIDTIIIESAGTGGNYEVRDTASGRSLTGVQTLAANSSTQIVVGKYVDGVYIQAFGADGQILVYHGDIA